MIRPLMSKESNIRNQCEMERGENNNIQDPLSLEIFEKPPKMAKISYGAINLDDTFRRETELDVNPNQENISKYKANIKPQYNEENSKTNDLNVEDKKLGKTKPWVLNETPDPKSRKKQTVAEHLDGFKLIEKIFDPDEEPENFLGDELSKDVRKRIECYFTSCTFFKKRWTSASDLIGHLVSYHFPYEMLPKFFMTASNVTPTCFVCSMQVNGIKLFAHVALDHEGLGYILNEYQDLKQFLISTSILEESKVKGTWTVSLPKNVTFKKLLKINANNLLQDPLTCPIRQDEECKTEFVNKHFLTYHLVEEHFKEKIPIVDKDICCLRIKSIAARTTHLAVEHNILLDIMERKCPDAVPKLCRMLKKAKPINEKAKFRNK